jgi:hypothetical protein
LEGEGDDKYIKVLVGKLKMIEYVRDIHKVERTILKKP